jgi:hypothetical protein
MELRRLRLVLVGRARPSAAHLGGAERICAIGTLDRAKTLTPETALGGNVDGSIRTRGSRRRGFGRAGSLSAVAFTAAYCRECTRATHRRNRDRYSASSRLFTFRGLSSLGHCGAGRHMDTRWARSHACRFAIRSIDAAFRFGAEQFTDRPRRQRLSRRRSARRLSIRLADRPFGTQEALLGYACGLSYCHRSHGPVVGRLELCRVPLSDRRRNRRRIHCHQFDNTGAYPRSPARLDRPAH